MFKHIAITGRIDTLDNLLAANPEEVTAEYRLANAAPMLRHLLEGCIAAHDQRRTGQGLTPDDPPHIAAARRFLHAIG
jgi:hypothetical protein